jgi:hypothetical protein
MAALDDVAADGAATTSTSGAKKCGEGNDDVKDMLSDQNLAVSTLQPHTV